MTYVVVTGASSDGDFGANSGGVYVFAKFDSEPLGNIKVGKWIQYQKLLPDDGETFDRFGNNG